MPCLESQTPTRLSLEQDSLHISVACRVVRLNHQNPQLAVLSGSIQHHVVNTLNSNLRTNSSLTPHQFYDWSLALSAVKDLLHHSSTDNVYNLLYDALHRFPQSSFPFQVLSSLWEDTLSVLRAQISTWLTYGIVDHSDAYFFIDSTQGNPRLLPQRLPCFISSESAHRILFAGNARKYTLRLTENTEDDHSQFHEQTSLRLQPLVKNPISAALSMEAATHYWRTSAANHLSHVLPFNQIRARIQSLRQYLLLGDALFWRTFFDELRVTPFLSRDRNTSPQVTEKGLNHILKSVTTDLLPDSTDAPLYIRVTDDDDLVPVFVLSFAEGQVLRARSSVYCDVFSIAFSVRRVACELRAAFLTLMTLRRPLQRCANRGKYRALHAALVTLFALRRRLAEFIESLEWYIQAEVLEPKFAGILRSFDEGERREPFFDVLCQLHNELMQKIFVQCFVDDVQINTRVNHIFGMCLDVCDYIEALSEEALLEEEHREFMKGVEQEFSRNIGLLLRMLQHVEEEHGDSRIAALLLRINFNKYVK